MGLGLCLGCTINLQVHQIAMQMMKPAGGLSVDFPGADFESWGTLGHAQHGTLLFYFFAYM
jgi:hypothetical protein